NTPRDFKARGDWAFCEGINQFVLHVVIHQPWDDKKPGINAPWGTEFNRLNTWIDYAGPWVDYLRRCSVMLQTGSPVADVAYFISEDAPKMAGIRQPELPAGYDFDYINADVIENSLSVKDGRFVLPNGVSYRLLVLPESDTMRPALLKKIAALVEAGGQVLGPKPERSPSLQDFPRADDEVKRLADGLWGNHRVMTGIDVSEALAKLETPADVDCPKDMLWKHRREGDIDIYFVSNQKREERTETISFRVDDRKPTLWRPDSGRIEPVRSKTRNGRTSMTLHFDPSGSVFVVFAKSSPRTEPRSPKLRVMAELNGPWTIAFPSGEITSDTLRSWTEQDASSIKYYSGTATYRTSFSVSKVGTTAILDLGMVHEMARVRVNGIDAGALWKQPYRLDISKALKKGENTLEVDVVNTWINRLIGDAQPGVATPETFTTTKNWKAESPLQPAGLLGPVQVVGNGRAGQETKGRR
ncbi:MAG: glycoside hydrolase family 2, partial [Candidatus Hydrogenedentes bacterium]|nr:glycoside hydrolase family 2 [Candidatus Hydrogenedentota bacterium]